MKNQYIRHSIDTVGYPSRTEKIVGNVEKMTGLEVEKFEFQYFDGVEGINESVLNDHWMNESESSVGDGGCLFGKFKNEEQSMGRPN